MNQMHDNCENSISQILKILSMYNIYCRNVNVALRFTQKFFGVNIIVSLSVCDAKEVAKLIRFR